jgi:hypothetical protein
MFRFAVASEVEVCAEVRSKVSKGLVLRTKVQEIQCKTRGRADR